MKHSNSQQTGSAHALIIVLVVAALIGALGWVYYSNFIAKKEPVAVEPSNSSAAEQNPAKRAKEYCVSTMNICFDEHDGWAVMKTTTEYPAKDSAMYEEGKSTILEGAIVEGPVTLTLATGYDSLGGAGCEEATYDQSLEVTEVAPTKLEGVADKDSEYDNKQVVAIKAILYRKKTKMYSPILLVTQRKEVSKKGTYNGCSWVWYDAVVRQKNIQESTYGPLSTFSFTSWAPAVGDGSPSQIYSTRGEAQKELASDSFTQAFKLLQSLRYKN